MNEILRKLENSKFRFDDALPIKGGDINDAFRLEKQGKFFFLKLNIADSFPSLFAKEKNNLEALGSIENIITPKVIEVGESNDNFQYLILEWLEKEEPSPKSWENFGKSLALLHQSTHKEFGWHEDNYIAIILQQNSYKQDWASFYAENRLIPMSKLLRDKAVFSTKEIKQIEELSKELNSIYPSEAPALLHGDLWNGNMLPIENDQFAFIDPASYYGHREMDIAMTRLFSGFSSEFYHSYQEIFPLEKNWEKRLEFSQLFPLMVHAYLFQGYYVNQVQTILKKI